MNEMENPLNDVMSETESPTEYESEIHVPEILLSQRNLIQQSDCASLVLIARINCPHFCDLTGTKVLLKSSMGDEWEVEITAFNGVENETDEIPVTTGSAAGAYSWTAVYQNTPEDGRPAHAEVSSTVSIEYQPHTVSLAVWDTPFPAIATETVAIKVGAKCNNNCCLSGSTLRVHDGQGEVAASVLGANPWQDTNALFWTNISFEVPAAVGTYKYIVSVDDSDNHVGTKAGFTLLVIEKPHNMIAVNVIDEETEEPIPSARISFHPYTELTDENGYASIPAATTKGDLRITAEGFIDERFNLAVTKDTNLSVMLKREPENLGDF